jgi:hypothetical protein
MRTALARTARLARDWREIGRGTPPWAMLDRTSSPSTRERSVEDVARYGGGLGGTHITGRSAPGDLTVNGIRSMPCPSMPGNRG